MDSEAGSNLQLETELSIQEHDNDNQQQQLQRNFDNEDSQEDSPGKTFKESVSELLVFSGQSVKAMVSSTVSIAVTTEWTEEENTWPPTKEDRDTQTERPAHDDEVINTADTEQEKTVLQSLGESIAQTTQSIKDVASDFLSADNDEEKSLLQSAGERIVQSAQSVKDAIHDSVAADDDETATASILVHTAID